jgi:hypothetical protein
MERIMTSPKPEPPKEKTLMELQLEAEMSGRSVINGNVRDRLVIPNKPKPKESKK